MKENIETTKAMIELMEYYPEDQASVNKQLLENQIAIMEALLKLQKK